MPLPVNVGIVMSCVGAGLQALTGAPELLNAIARDDIMPILNVLRPSGPSQAEQESARKLCVFVTYILASLPCLAGNLDYITPPVTMFFLTM